MDADIIRLLLFLAGAGLVLGIYLWDRRKRASGSAWAIREAQRRKQAFGREEPRWRAQMNPRAAAREEEEHPAEDGLDPLDEPAVGDLDLPQPKSGSKVTARERLMNAFAGQVSRPRPEREERPARPAPVTRRSREDEEGNADDSVRPIPREEEDPPEIPANVPNKILQLSVVCRQAPFAGEAIVRAAQQLGLMYGEMQIYHRREGKSSSPVFSMASLVEPGTFPIKEMGDFATPGLLLFAQLPGPKDSLTIFSEMLSTAERLAKLLQGEILDDRRQPLSRQFVEDMREQILEHRRLVRLARIKR